VIGLHVAIDGACWWNDRGFGRFTREMVRALLSRSEQTGIHYTLVMEHDRPPGCEILPPPANADVVLVGTASAAQAMSGRGARSPAHMLRMGQALGAARADVVFFPAVYSWVPVWGNAPSVLTVHDAIPERFPRLVFPRRRNELLWRIKSRLARASASRILTVSDASASELVDVLGVAPSRIDRTSEAADPVFAARPGAPRGAVTQSLGLADGPFVVYVGGFNAHKNVPCLLEAFAQVRGDVSLVLVGDASGGGFHDDVPALRAWLAERPAVARRVAFAGWLADDALVDVYNTASALVLPSLAEGFGLPAVEAMACGCPVLCSDSTSLPEVVGEAGLLFDPTDPAAIARCIERVLTDDALAERLSDLGLARAATFTWDRGARLTEASLRAAARA